VALTLVAPLVVAAALWLPGATPAGAAPGPDTAPATSSWTVYHQDAEGTGVDQSGVTFSPADPAWTSPVLDGQLYGEPLEYAGRVYAATENDTVYALAADTGAVLWSEHLGTPVPASDLPCGDIGPTVGITGTPVIDAHRGEIFVVADEVVAGQVTHVLYGLNIYSGGVVLSQAVDPTGGGYSAAAQLQRTGLNLDNGSVVFGMGGNDGDCAFYHGWVISVPEGGGTPKNWEVDSGPGETQGAVWMGGAAPEVDAGGNVWFAAGNGSVNRAGGPYDDSDSVTELSPGMTLEQIFAPSTWYSDNGSDFDLGSSPPALLGDGQVVQIGKSHVGYLLDGSHLGGIGGQVSEVSGICNADNDGGEAVVGTTVYEPCQAGLEAVQASSNSLSVLWHSSSGASAPPIVAGGLVWAIGGSTLLAINPSTGASVQQLSLGSEANHFPTPSVGDGLLLAPSADQVHAFTGSAGRPGPPAAIPPGQGYWEVAADGGIFAFGGAPYAGSMGGRPLFAPIVGMAATPDGHGYWEVAADGGIFAFGDATFAGSMGGRPLSAPIVGMAATPDGHGYWEVASDGGIFAFGDATFAGSMGGRPLSAPVVGMAAAPDGHGYWEVAADGGIFAFGGAPYAGSMGGRPLSAPVVGMAAPPTGVGYWEVSADGGIFALGDARYYGSIGGQARTAPVVGMAATTDGGGYLMAAADGGDFAFGDAGFYGSVGGRPLAAPVVAVDLTPTPAG